jgi:hypothetical protein
MKVLALALVVILVSCASRGPVPDGYEGDAMTESVEPPKAIIQEQAAEKAEEKPAQPEGHGVGKTVLLGVAGVFKALGSAFAASSQAQRQTPVYQPAPIYQAPVYQPSFNKPVYTNCTKTGLGSYAQVNCTSY